MYSGAFLQCYGQVGVAASCSKVSAYLGIDAPGVAPSGRWRRLGNHHADVAGKRAVSLHPRDEGLLQDADRMVSFARATLKLAAH
eukprot:6728286-Pyramimonas_sp.AAC.1